MAEKKDTQSAREAAVQSALDEQVKIRQAEGEKADKEREAQEKAAADALKASEKDTK